MILKKIYNLFLGITFILWPLSYALQAQNLYLIISHHLLLCKNYEPSWRVHTSSSILMSFICLSSNDKVLQRCLRREYMTGQWFMNMISFYVAKRIMIWLWYFVLSSYVVFYFLGYIHRFWRGYLTLLAKYLFIYHQQWIRCILTTHLYNSNSSWSAYKKNDHPLAISGILHVGAKLQSLKVTIKYKLSFKEI